MGAMVLSLSGCGGSSSSSSSFVENNDVPAVAEVAVIDSPVFEQGHSYTLITGARLSNMSGAKYFVANVGSEAAKSALNLGFTEQFSSQTLAFVDDSTGQVVFAYNPSGTGSKSTGTVNYSGGTKMKYTSLNLRASSMFSAMNVDTSGAKVIQLNGTTATIDGTSIASCNYVWHADPDHRDEYYTDGLDGIIEYDEDEVLSNITMTDGVYIARDVHYMTDSLDFTALVANDQEQEYAAYYSDTVRAVVSNELGGSLTGPYIFATLPMSMGMGGGMPGGNMPSGDFTPGGNMPSGDFAPGGNMPSGDRPAMPDGNMPSGDRPGTPPGGSGGVVETPMISATVRNNGASYNSQIASTISLMTHSETEAYANPVLHITKAGVYQLQGTWNGQIWIDVGETSSDKVAVILNSVDVTCTVAPAIVFHDLYECGPDDNYVDEIASRMKADSSDIGSSVLDDAGAMVIIADGTTNNFKGANVYRMLKPQAKKSSVTTIDGTDVSQQKKRWKMDGAFYSFVSLAIGGGSKADGVLNITSTTYEGLDAELHMTLESGTVTVTAPDDGINVNEDDTSVFTMLGGNLTITSTNGDGIDSNGWIAILGGSLDITAAQDSAADNAQADGPIDADCDVYIDYSSVTYTHRAGSSSGSGSNTPPSAPASGDMTPLTSGDTKPAMPESSDVTPPAPTVSDDVSSDTTGQDTSNNTPSTNPPSNNPPSTPSGDNSGGSTGTDTGTDTSTDDTSSDTSGDTPTGNNDTSTDTGSDTGTDNQADSDASNGTTTPTTPETSTGWETESISGTTGTTVFSLGASSGSSTEIIIDTDTSPRNINTTDNVFRITRRVNTFSGITADE